jgi:chaperone modulatory protein CbpM
MKQAADALRYDEATDIAWTELVAASGWPEAELAELVRYGVIAPRDAAAPTWTFEARTVVVARTAWRLRCDFELDPYGVSVCLGFVERIAALEDEVRRLRAQLG